jgi:FAD/FMN-containing dehydrogenase
VDSAKEQLISLVGQENVQDAHQNLEAYATDQSFALEMKPRLVVRPKSVQEVQALVRWANDTRTPLIPVSSGPPHFHGDTVPGVPGAVMVELFLMNRILNIDRRNKMAVIEPGVTFEQLQPELAEEGLRVNMPLLPRRNKSVIASLLERQPTTVPRYDYSLTEPLRNCGVVWGNGEITYTGEAGNMPLSLEEQWNKGVFQVDPKGPAQTDFFRLLTGAQGSMGIAVWASIKCELLPGARKLFFVPAERLEELVDFSYRVQRLRLGDEVMLLNRSLFARMLAATGEPSGLSEDGLPPWVMIIGLAGRAYFPEERVGVQEKDIDDVARQFNLTPQTEIGGISGERVLEIILNPCGEPYWKQKHKGAFQDIFFLTTLDKIPQYIEVVNKTAGKIGYPSSQIGIYIQPQHQGVSHHCEFNLPFDPQDAEEEERVKEMYFRASEELIERGAYFSRPYGIWADMVYRRDASSAAALRKIKSIFDPQGVMNPGKLCF